MVSFIFIIYHLSDIEHRGSDVQLAVRLTINLLVEQEIGFLCYFCFFLNEKYSVIYVGMNTFCLCSLVSLKSFKDWVNLVQFQHKCSNSKGFYWLFPFFLILTRGTKCWNLQIFTPVTETQDFYMNKMRTEVFSESSLRIQCNTHSGRYCKGWADKLSLTHIPGLSSDCHPISNTSSGLNSRLATICVHCWCLKGAICLGYIRPSLQRRFWHFQQK